MSAAGRGRNRAAVWLLGARPRTLVASIVPVVVGTAAAEQPDPRFAGAALVVAVALQVGVNYANDYADGMRGVDTAARVGPVRLTASGLASARAVRRAALAALGVAAVAGTALSLATDPRLLALGAAAVAAALLYAGGPRPYGALGLGEAAVFVFFGLVATVGTAYVQGLHVPAAAWWAAVPIGLLAVAILIANNLRDILTDREAGKRTLAERLGERRTRILYGAVVGIALATPVAGVAAGALPPGALLSLAAAPIAIGAMVRVSRARGRDLLPLLTMSAALELLFGLLLAMGLVAARP